MLGLIPGAESLKLGSNLLHNRPKDLLTKLRPTLRSLLEEKPHGHVNVGYLLPSLLNSIR
jgi:hypothetical protein